MMTGAILLTAFIFVFDAQAQKDDPELIQLREDQTASRFYDKVMAAEPRLVLVNFRESTPIDAPSKPIGLIFKKGSEDVTVNITEYPSEEAAKLPFKIQMNADVRQLKGYGDEGTKTFSAHGKSVGAFAGLAFRKGRFYLAVFCSDEKLAEKLATQALETIGS